MPYTGFPSEGDFAYSGIWVTAHHRILENLNRLETILWPEDESRRTRFHAFTRKEPVLWTWTVENSWTIRERIDQVRKATGFAPFQWPVAIDLQSESRFFSAKDLKIVSRAVGYPIETGPMLLRGWDHKNKSCKVKRYSTEESDQPFTAPSGGKRTKSWATIKELHETRDYYTDDAYSWNWIEIPDPTINYSARWGCCQGEQRGEWTLSSYGVQGGVCPYYQLQVSDADFSGHAPQMFSHFILKNKDSRCALFTEDEWLEPPWPNEDLHYWKHVVKPSNGESNLKDTLTVNLIVREVSSVGGSGDCNEGSLNHTIGVFSGAHIQAVIDIPIDRENFLLGFEFNDSMEGVDSLIPLPGTIWRRYCGSGSRFLHFKKSKEIQRELSMEIKNSVFWVACKD